MKEIFLQNACRICLAEEGIMLNIFDEVEEFNVKLSFLIEKITGIKIECFNEYPKLICGECTNELLIAVKFKEKCEKTEQVLSTMIVKNKLEDELQDTEDLEEEEQEDLLDNSIDEDPEFNIEHKINLQHFVKIEENRLDMSKVLNIKTEEKEEIISDNEIIPNINELYEDVEYLETDDNIEYIIFNAIEEEEQENNIFETQQNENNLEENDIEANVEPFNEIMTDILDSNYNKTKIYDNANISNDDIIINNNKGIKPKLEEVQEEIKNIKIMRPTVINHNCELCGAGFAHLINFKRHMSSAHQIDDLVTCSICFVNLNNQDELISHMNSHEYNKFDELKDKKQLDIEEDVDMDNPKKPHLCHFCNKGFVSKSALKSHTRTHTGEKPFNCSICNKQFTTLGGLDLHQRRHTGNKPFRCQYCSQRFVESSNLKVHLRIHTGEKPHKCTWCQKSFSRVFLLQIHLRTHTGEKPYSCDVCEKSFAQQGDLSSHKKIHTGERPHCCKICQKGFIKTSGLNQHMRKHFKSNNDENITKAIHELIEGDLSNEEIKYISIDTLIKR